MDPITVTVVRGELPESRHYVDAVVSDTEGSLLAAAGEPRMQTYWRSSAKPFQALSLVADGGMRALGLSEADVAIMCASHSGEEAHVAQARHVLQAAGLDESDLQCGPHAPLHRESAERLYQKGETPTAIHCNCSGKHAGMLAHSRLLGADPAGYMDSTHPVQRRILETVADFTGVESGRILLGVDGCGVPVFGLPLAAMARAYARLAAATSGTSAMSDAAGTVVKAMQSFPYLVAGTGRLCTDLMDSLAPAVVAKGGAEGIYCAGLTGRGLGIALKVRDGSARGCGPAVLEIIDALGVVDITVLARLRPHRRPVLTNHAGSKVGYVEAQLPEEFRQRLREVGEASHSG